MRELQWPRKRISVNFKILTNAASALAAQLLFYVALVIFIALRPRPASDEEVVTSFLIAGCATILLIALTGFLLNKFLLDERRDRDREILRAVYFSAIGLSGICFLNAMLGSRRWESLVFLGLCLPLLLLGNYHMKFREAREDNWFPHTVFQFGVQFGIFFGVILLMVKILGE